jgi:hypothetical protein
MSRDALERGRQIARERYGRSETEPASDGEPVEPVDVDAAAAPRDPTPPPSPPASSPASNASSPASNSRSSDEP